MNEGYTGQLSDRLSVLMLRQFIFAIFSHDAAHWRHALRQSDISPIFSQLSAQALHTTAHA
jgi:hypothetical protein